jgi:hypothetical protein
MQTIEYAIRYCVGRNSYAFNDGLDLAEQHWAEISGATKRDVLSAIRHNEPSDLVRWPTIRAARYPQGGQS